MSPVPGLPDAFAAAPEPPRAIPVLPPHFLVAIYTLTESVGKRAAELLKSLYPGIRVELVHDHVSTPRLEELARNANVFVVVWRSAKHAATQAIEQLRPALPTLYPPGSGCASLLRIVAAFLTAQFSSD